MIWSGIEARLPASLRLGAGGADLVQQVARRRLQGAWDLYSLFEGGFGLRNLVSFSIRPAQAIQGGCIRDLVLALAAEQIGGSFQFRNRSGDFILLGVGVAEGGMRNSRRQFAGSVSVGRVSLCQFNHFLRIGNRLAQACGAWIFDVSVGEQ